MFESASSLTGSTPRRRRGASTQWGKEGVRMKRELLSSNWLYVPNWFSPDVSHFTRPCVIYTSLIAAFNFGDDASTRRSPHVHALPPTAESSHHLERRGCSTLILLHPSISEKSVEESLTALCWTSPPESSAHGIVLGIFRFRTRVFAPARDIRLCEDHYHRHHHHYQTTKVLQGHVQGMKTLSPSLTHGDCFLSSCCKALGIVMESTPASMPLNKIRKWVAFRFPEPAGKYVYLLLLWPMG